MALIYECFPFAWLMLENRFTTKNGRTSFYFQRKTHMVALLQEAPSG
jgi:hypothetical protein